MKCLIVVPSVRRAGAETQAVELANGLSQRGHEVHVFTFQPHMDQRRRLRESVSFHHQRRQTKVDFSIVRAIAAIIDEERIEIVLSVLQIAALSAWLGVRRSRRKPPLVAGVHTTYSRGVKDEIYNRLLYRRILRRLAAVVFVCDSQRKYWVNRFPELQSLAEVVYNGIDPARFRRSDQLAAAQELRAALGIDAAAIVFSCIAGFRPEKNHRLLIEAFSMLPPNTHLIFAGDGEERARIEAAARARRLTSRIAFLGAVEDVRPVIVASDATLLASTAVETFSMAMLESMAMEVPMIATAIGGLPEAIVHGKTGLLCSIGDVDSLATQMHSLIDNPRRARELGLAAAESVRSRFTLESMVSGYEAVIYDVLKAS